MARFRHRRVLLAHEHIIRIRGPPPPTNYGQPKPDAEGVRDIQGHGQGDVAKREGVRQGRCPVRGY